MSGGDWVVEKKEKGDTLTAFATTETLQKKASFFHKKTVCLCRGGEVGIWKTYA